MWCHSGCCLVLFCSSLAPCGSRLVPFGPACLASQESRRFASEKTETKLASGVSCRYDPFIQSSWLDTPINAGCFSCATASGFLGPGIDGEVWMRLLESLNTCWVWRYVEQGLEPIARGEGNTLCKSNNSVENGCILELFRTLVFS